MRRSIVLVYTEFSTNRVFLCNYILKSAFFLQKVSRNQRTTIGPFIRGKISLDLNKPWPNY